MRRRLFNLAMVVSLVLGVLTVAMWTRSLWRTDLWTALAGDTFCVSAVTRDGVSVQWLSGVPKDSTPPKSKLGRSSYNVGMSRKKATGDRRDGLFINVPDATFRANHYGGVELWWGVGQILQPIWIIYRASPLLPLHGIGIGWGTMLLCLMIVPAARVALWLRGLWIARVRGRRGMCPTCGYDMRATPERCPECGTVAAKGVTKCDAV